MRRGLVAALGELGSNHMKHVVSVSLGSSRRDHRAVMRLLGTEVEVWRRGFDGDVEAAFQAIRGLEGQVDAIGLGGLDVFLYVAGQRYVIADGLRLLQAAGSTPVVDGSGLKRTLEPMAVRWLDRHGPLALAGLPVLLVSALDRYGMAVALQEAGCAVVYGDLMFSAGIPYPIESLPELERIARRLAREMTKLPVRMLYPTGSAQEVAPEPRFIEQYAAAQMVAGDFHLIRRHLPDRSIMEGKAVLTQTTTADDRALLRAVGVRWLFTTTPMLDGRSFGTNALEAAMVAVLGKPPDALSLQDLDEFLQGIDYRPEVIDLAVQPGRL